ncbi:sensor histidine kinase [Bacillus methanolicus]|uniref:histidine kinase n=1 Tax=Bacillus methanolicus (strain MGA3 / ATCC 53907) TaxID=796606 RepID=I3E7B3_BACMM|nr:HAMP domain-containing sensor histidine kinase [Bacillus methanolicus]AIE59214.1 Sensor histidine kinase YclK [Bacillus methanolicus MGA3]EIJ82384.1 YclK [Bacillus methanolicus MGA3]
MKIKYFYQQFISHISTIIVAFLILSLLFAHYVESLVYNNKAEELITYGENILMDLEQSRIGSEQILDEYEHVLAGRNIQFSLFDENLKTSIGGHRAEITLSKEEWNKILKGDPIVVKNDIKRFDKAVTFVLLPYFQNGTFLGGILLTSPISGSREMITKINQYLFYTVLIALVVSLFLSWILSKIHVNRIKRIQEATSMVSAGDYSVNIPSSNFDEIGELAEDFNKMVQKLKASKEEIESLENRRRQFMADVSHELRTPLTTISGVIEGLRNDMIPEEEKDRGLQLVSQETKRLIRLVNENLDYEKIRSNQVKLMKEDIQLIEVLEIIKDQLDILADEKNNRIIVEVDEDLFVYADYDRLMQILLNITKNSIQFTENGTIWLRGKASDKETIIEIEDTGIGIDPAEIEKIWHRFYKADLSRTSNPYGEFGLGLSIVKQLVNLHNGKIEVTSEKGKGTKFVIRFPIFAEM